METIILEQPSDYDLFIRSVAESWMGNVMSGMWIKRVSAEEFAKIRENPLQDFIGFGVQAVIFVEIEHYPIYRNGDYTIETSTPDDVISAWNRNCMYLKERAEKVYEEMMDDFYEGRMGPQRIR
jgi:hypothetical protein